MLSYRHAFHAGNHADVLKHFVLDQILEYASNKDKPFWYIDTHAGAGLYALETGYAAKNAEYRNGIGLLWPRNDLPAPLARYVDAVRSCNPDGRLRFYPGSPVIARRHLRDTDRMRLFELHPSDRPLLQRTFAKDGRRVMVVGQDGFAGLKALLPPPPRRAVVLIDPSYEEKQDYARVVDALKDSLQRFATGTYILWYPLLQRGRIALMQKRLAQLDPHGWLHLTLTVQSPSAEGFGMHGSGLFIINPPWTLPSALEDTLPTLTRLLGRDAAAGYTLQHHIP